MTNYADHLVSFIWDVADLHRGPYRLVVYQPEVNPIRIMAVLRGNRNVKHILKERLHS